MTDLRPRLDTGPGVAAPGERAALVEGPGGDRGEPSGESARLGVDLAGEHPQASPKPVIRELDRRDRETRSRQWLRHGEIAAVAVVVGLLVVATWYVCQPRLREPPATETVAGDPSLDQFRPEPAR